MFGHVKGIPGGKLTQVPTAEKTEHLFARKELQEKYFKEVVKFGIQRARPEEYGKIQV